jgi:hypothetical protein
LRSQEKMVLCGLPKRVKPEKPPMGPPGKTTPELCRHLPVMYDVRDGQQTAKSM